MSIEVKQILFVGKVFKTEQKLLDYLVESKVISKEVSDEYLERFHNDEGSLEDIVEIEHISNFPQLSMCDFCLGVDPFLGYIIELDVRNGTNSEQFNQDIINAKKNWNSIFGDTVELQEIIQYK